MQNTTTPSGAATYKTLADVELDKKIADRIRMIESACAARDDALKAVTECEKSAVISGWRLGRFLTERKRRLGHGRWLPWLSAIGLGERQARLYLRLAEIGLESDLADSITKTLARLDSAARDDAVLAAARDDAVLAAARDDADLARAWWRTWMAGAPRDSPEWCAIVQATPDGPVSGRLWLNFLERIAAAETAEALRAAYDRRPWATP